MTPVALITGGQQGIGLGIAEALAGAGFSVALTAEMPPDSAPVKGALERLEPFARYFQHDLQDIDHVPKLLDSVRAELGPVTTLASNAGVPASVRGDMLNLTPDSFDFVLGVNLRGAFFLAQEVARRMAAEPSPHYRSITFVTSVSAAMVSVERAEYCISKAGAAMMAGLFAARLAADGIGVFELRPGIIETGMTAGARDRYTARIEDGLVPAGRWGQPADIGSVVVPLATGKMAFATGAVIPVDGGLSIPRL
ncbi:3-oxoacyl-[acyl-carrier-protein] reductase FabG1 [Defluviimonas aquaemixtae]|uniref:3-oxoacyl-[acyl-carrier-protein] reductase FabG1 n=1 Tax=Albidovulum aquaemixtae TaxID=1542388 RepID=A0A2R8B3M6_9RHOB|nr:3-ketoacyl-ACP reductase [Defluviimonas aquaemixtae]SPH17195.1 3-oxoacyl-[acyl-carrier-protein] reductase FabG1 [Defluviimonas aquaemixtae]